MVYFNVLGKPDDQSFSPSAHCPGNMAIADGLQAGVAYEKLTGNELGPREKARLRKALLAYCEQDSLAMVRLLEHLKRSGVME